MPRVSDDLRYSVRDITAGRMLEQLGSKERLDSWQNFALNAHRVLQIVHKDCKSLPMGVQKQMQKVHLFASEIAKPPAKAEEQREGQGQYLLGQFDCLCVPARADYNSSFMPMAPLAGAGATNDPLKGAAALEAGMAGVPDCDGASGFGGWFWVVHSAAPNIGESEEADDFGAYSEQVVDEPSPPSPAGPSPAGPSPTNAVGSPTSSPPQRRLREDLYVSDMARLWRCALAAMGRLEVDEAILFPFGMGAFLRHLGQNDSRYNDPVAMRKLRRRIADELMKAIVDLCIGGPTAAGKSAPKAAAPPKAPPKGAKAASSAGAAGVPRGPVHVHLCLVVANAESVENHNSFVEAAAEASRSCRGLQDVLRLRRNVDTLQLAHDLVAQGEGAEKSLKVAILNGANRELVGNHWFEDGARFAIDENLHRRSASLARAALLLNFDTEARPRRPTQLSDNVRFFGGTVAKLAGPGIVPAGAAGAPAKGGGLFSCCKRRAPDDARPQAAQPAKAKPGKCTKGHKLKPWVATGGWCNGCQREVKAGEQVMDCRPCDYFLCQECHPQGKTGKPPAKAPAQAAKGAATATSGGAASAAAPARAR